VDTVTLLTRAYEARGRAPIDDATKAKLVVAAAKQVELFGIQRTTMEDVAKRAGVSRVTVYRHFPGRDELIGAVLLHEVERFLTSLGAHLDGLRTDEERIVEGFVFTVVTLREHALLRRLVEGEPELFLPQLTTGAGPLIDYARTLIVAWAADRTDLQRDELAILAEVGVRLALSFVITPSAALELDDEDGLRQVVRRALGPVLTSRRRARPTR